MTVINNATLVLKDSQGNKGVVKSLTDNDINKISSAITDVGQVVDPATHMPIEATKTSAGVVQLATAQDITNGTAGKVVDAKELNDFAQTLPAANGVTDVSSGDNSNQLVVSRIGGSKTLTIDNVEHASNADEATHASQADTATSANSVAWDNVSGKPSTFTPSAHTHDDRYYTESEIDTKLSGKSDTTHNHNSAYLGITAKAESAKSADSVAWANVSGKPSSYTPSSHTHDDRYYTESEIDTKLGGKANTSGALFTVNGLAKPGWSKIGTGEGGSCIQVKTTDNTYPSICFHRSGHSHCVLAESDGQLGTMQESNGTFNHLITSANIGSQSVNYANSAGSVAWSNVSSRPTKVSQFTNDSKYITGITKAMVTTALGYTPPTSDTNTHYTTTLYAGAKDAKSNAATTNGNTYIKLYDDSTVRSQLNIKGSGATSVTTDANGVITISSTDNNTTYSKLSQFTNDSGYITSSGTAATISQKVNASAKTHTNYNTNGTYVPTMNFLSFWDGAYNSKGNSNLTYCANGTIIGSSNIGSQSVNYAKSAGSVAWSNVSGRPTKVSQFTNDSKYLTGITKAMVTTALGYTPPTSDTNTWNALKGSTTSAAGTAGYAPAPAAGAANRYLRCDGTWQVPPDHTYTVNNATLTIQKNGTNVATFTSNASSNVTANISVPTKVSQLTNDVGFITSTNSSLEMYDTTPYIDFHANKSTKDHTSRIIDQGTANVGRLRILSRYDSISYQVEMYKNFFEPVNDNEICLGDSANRWRNIFSATGSISTSDQRAKNSIENIDDSLLDAWSNVQPKQYKFNDATKEKGDSARYHTGYLAQDIQKACEDSKISIDRYGLFCHDSWEEQDEVVENIESEVDGIKTTEKRIVQQKREKGDMYALRYEEALVVECAYLRRENSRMKEKLVSLEERLEKLEKAEK